MEQRFIDLYNERRTDTPNAAALRSTPQGTHRRMTIAAMLVGLLDRSGEGMLKVLDVGCGFGELYDYLDKDVVEYTGVDALDWVVSAGKTERPNANLIHGNIHTPGVEQADIVVALGVIATVPPGDRRAFIQGMAAKADVGLVLSFLDLQYEDKIECGFYPYSVEALLEDVQNVRPDLQLVGLVRPAHGITTLVALGKRDPNHF